MMTEGTNGTGDGFDPQDDEALWRLLDRQAPPKAVSPYFSRRVLREVALAEQRDATGWWARLANAFPLAPRRMAQWSGALALGVFCLTATLTSLRGPVTLSRPSLTEHTPTPVAPALALAAPASVVRETAAPEEKVSAQDVEVIADLDNILQREESRLWTEDTARY